MTSFIAPPPVPDLYAPPPSVVFADQSAALQTIYDRAAAIGPGARVIHQAGTYLAAGLLIDSYVQYEGVAQGGTTIKLKDNAGAVALMSSRSFAALASQNGGAGAGTSTAGEHNFQLDNLTLDGNAANNPTATDVLQIYGYDYGITSTVRIQNAKRDGVYAEWAAGVEPAVGVAQARWGAVSILGSGRHDLNFNGPHDTQFGPLVLANKAGAPTGHGLWLQSKAPGCQFAMPHVWGTGHDYAYYIEALSYFTNPQGEGASVAEAIVRVNDTQWVGAKLFGAGGNTAVKGLIIGDVASGNITGTCFDGEIYNTTLGAIDVTHSGGSGNINVRAFNGGSVVGTPPTGELFIVYGCSPAPIVNFGANASIQAVALTDGNSIASGTETMARTVARDQSIAPVTQELILTYFTARKSETVNNVRVNTGNTAAAATPTLCRIGLYSVDGAGNLTLVASTANDTTLFAGTFTVYTRAFSVGYALVAGSRYALGLLVVSAAAMPKFGGIFPGGGVNAEIAIAPQLAGHITAQADLPAGPVAPAGGGYGGMFYGVVTP